MSRFTERILLCSFGWSVLLVWLVLADESNTSSVRCGSADPNRVDPIKEAAVRQSTVYGIIVDWLPPDDAAIWPYYFILTCQSCPTKLANTTEETYQFSGLKAASEYVVSIQAGHGHCRLSTDYALIGRTALSNLRGPLSISDVGETSFTVTWTASPDTGIQYEVSCAKALVNQPTARCEGLPSGAQIDFTVRTVKAGFHKSNLVYGRALTDLFAVNISQVECTVLDTAIHVLWTPSVTTGVSYQLTCRCLGCDSDVIRVASFVPMATCDQLRTGRAYRLTVAVKKEGFRDAVSELGIWHTRASTEQTTTGAVTDYTTEDISPRHTTDGMMTEHFSFGTTAKASTTEQTTTEATTTATPSTDATTSEDTTSEATTSEKPTTETPTEGATTTATLTLEDTTADTPTTEATTEASTPKSTTPEATTPESTTQEPTTPEATTPEAKTLEATTLDATTQEPTTPESTTPEPTTPEATTPEATTPEATTQESTTPEATTPEATTPEASTPEATTPEATNPEETTPDASSPEARSTTTTEAPRGPCPSDQWLQFSGFCYLLVKGTNGRSLSKAVRDCQSRDRSAHLLWVTSQAEMDWLMDYSARNWRLREDYRAQCTDCRFQGDAAWTGLFRDVSDGGKLKWLRDNSSVSVRVPWLIGPSLPPNDFGFLFDAPGELLWRTYQPDARHFHLCKAPGNY